MTIAFTTSNLFPGFSTAATTQAHARLLSGSERRQLRTRLCFLLSVLAGLATAGQSHANRIRHHEFPPAVRDAESVRFDLYRGYCIVVHGSAGPLKNLNFVLDTGTIRTTFSARIAKKLNLSDELFAGLVSIGGKEGAEDAMLPSLAFGPIQRSNLEIYTADLSFVQDLLPVRVDGIIGLDVLGRRHFVIDYSARVIRFGPAPALSVSVPLRLDGGLAVFDAEIDHKPVRLLFDTGAAALVLFKSDAGPTPAAMTAGGEIPDAGVSESRRVWLGSLKVGLEEFGRKPALVARNPKPSQFDFDGLLSPTALGISQVSVDLDQGVLAFSR